MIDTHLHILPGIDDGPETIGESVALARGLVEQGVHGAIATPHYNDEFPRRSALEIRALVSDLQRVLDQHGIPLRLFAGHEALIGPGLIEDIQAGRLATLNGSRYLLLELWNSSWLPETERVIFELRAFGIVPIIAHPERYRVIQNDPARLTALVQQGVLAQLTASSLLGMQGNSVRRTAEGLLRKGLIHFIASDAHGMNKRPPAVVEGLRCAERLLGGERVHQMVEIWPTLVIDNQLCYAHPARCR